MPGSMHSSHLPPLGGPYLFSSSSFSSQLCDSLAANNEAPSDVDLAAIRDYVLPNARRSIASLDEKFARIEVETKNLRVQQAQLIAEKRRLERTVSQSHGIVSTLRLLPVEVLTEIFIHYCEDENNLAFDMSVGPWLLSRVCRRWRSITIATQSLWTFFNLKSPARCPSGWRKILTAKLAHAGTQGVLLSIYNDAQDKAEETLLSQWLSFMVQRSSRWRHLIVRFGTSCHLVHDLADIPPNLSLPLLRTLSLDFEGSLAKYLDRHNITTMPVIQAFSTAPQLRHVRLIRPCDGIALPYPQLLTIYLFTYSALGLERILNNVGPGLRSLTTASERPGMGSNRYLPAPPHPTPLPDLRRLAVEVTGYHRQFWISAPLLDTLEVTYLGHVDLAALAGFLQRSRPPLQKFMLTVSWCFEDPANWVDDLVKLLLQFICTSPSLREVVLRFEHLSSRSAEAMVLDVLQSRVLHTMLPAVIPFTIRLPSSTFCHPS